MSEPGVGRARGRARGRTKEPEQPTILRAGENPSGVSPGLPVTPDPSIPGQLAKVSLNSIKEYGSCYSSLILGSYGCESFTKTSRNSS